MVVGIHEEIANMIQPNQTILFQGDSITDVGRNRGVTGPNETAGFGQGYPLLLGSYLLGRFPTYSLKIYNRGISGNRVPDLHERWQADCLDLKPDILSILIGVNDIWHKLNGNYDGTVKDYEEGYHNLLDRTRRELPDVKLVICEPFVLRTGAVDDRWFPEFDERRAVAKKQAEVFAATFVPLQEVYDLAVQDAKPTYWTGDGVHPTMAGHAKLAMAWGEAVIE